jgi:hypothetical protein
MVAQHPHPHTHQPTGMMQSLPAKIMQQHAVGNAALGNEFGNKMADYILFV